MKVGLCVSHEYQNAVSYLSKILEKKINKLSSDWSLKFSKALDNHNIEYGILYIDRNDWIEKASKYDILIWKPKFMGTESSQFFKEKVYFMQYIMEKRIYPNFETIWHFDSKIAQKYLLEYENISVPKTFISFDYNESIDATNKVKYPIVFKKSNGAGSTGVELIKSKKQIVKKINFKFIWAKVINKLFKTHYDNYGHIYFQEFIEENPGDLRINIIGDKYAVGFWRMNRDKDFRASGSGRIDYYKDIPHNAIKYCANISIRNKFDSMAYDILFREDKLFIVEMSYGYVDTAIYNANGYYTLNHKGEIEKFTEGHYWPQELWVKWIVEDSNLQS